MQLKFSKTPTQGQVKVKDLKTKDSNLDSKTGGHLVNVSEFTVLSKVQVSVFTEYWYLT